MLQNVEAKPVSKRLPFKIGQFVVYPSHGLCVYGGPQETVTSVGTFQTHSFFQVGTKGLALSVPNAKLAESGIIRAPKSRTIKKVIEQLSAPAKRTAPNWKRQLESLKDTVGEEGVVSTAKIIHIALSSKRGGALPSKPVTSTPVDVNYTLKTYVNDAMDILVPIFQLRMGLSEERALDMIYRSVLQKGYTETIDVLGRLRDTDHLTDKEFEAAFGIAKQEARKPDTVVSLNNVIVLDTVKTEKKKPTNVKALLAKIEAEELAAIQKRQADQAANKDLGGPSKPSSTGNTGGSKKRAALNVKPALKEEFDTLHDLLPSTPHAITAFKLAGQVLDTPEELRLVTKLWLAHRDKKSDIQSLAAEFNQPAEAIIVKARDLAGRMRQAGEENDVRAMKKIKFEIPKIGA